MTERLLQHTAQMLSTYCGPDVLLAAGDSAVSTRDEALAPMGLMLWLRRRQTVNKPTNEYIHGVR